MEEIKANIWDKYTHVNTDGKTVTDLKNMIIQLHAEIEMLHDAVSHIINIVDTDRQEESKIITPKLILPG